MIHKILQVVIICIIFQNNFSKILIHPKTKHSLIKNYIMGLLDFLQSGTLNGSIKHFVSSYYRYSTLTYEKVGEHSKSDIFTAILYERHLASKKVSNSYYYDKLDIDKFIDYVDEDFALFVMFMLMLDSKTYRKAFKIDASSYYKKINSLLSNNGYDNSHYQKSMGAFSLASFFFVMFKTYGD